MNIIFDKVFKQRMFQMVKPKAKNDRCPFCDTKITGKNFRGAMWVDGEFRMFDGSIFCLFKIVDIERAKLDATKHEIDQ